MLSMVSVHKPNIRPMPDARSRIVNGRDKILCGSKHLNKKVTVKLGTEGKQQRLNKSTNITRH